MNSERAYFRTEGRISRSEFISRFLWMSGLVLFIFYLMVKHAESKVNEIWLVVLFLIGALISLILYIQAVKRAHDLGKQGFWALIPILNFDLFTKHGDKHENKYGVPPNAQIEYSSEIIFTDENSKKPNLTGRLILPLLFFLVGFIVLMTSIPQNSSSKEVRGERQNNISKYKQATKPNGKSIHGANAEEIKGPVEKGSFSDDDGDGVANENDNCPLVYGSRLNNGCPESIDNSTKKKLNVIQAPTLSILREKIKTFFDGKSLDLESFNYDPSRNLINFNDGNTTVYKITMILDPNSSDLVDRIEQIEQKNLPKQTVVLSNGEFNEREKLYVAILAFVDPI